MLSRGGANFTSASLLAAPRREEKRRELDRPKKNYNGE